MTISISKTCPRCGGPLDILVYMCSNLDCSAGVIPLNRPTSPAQDEAMERVNDGQVTQVIGKTVECDPEYSVIQFLRIYKFLSFSHSFGLSIQKWVRNFQLKNKLRS